MNVVLGEPPSYRANIKLFWLQLSVEAVRVNARCPIAPIRKVLADSFKKGRRRGRGNGLYTRGGNSLEELLATRLEVVMTRKAKMNGRLGERDGNRNEGTVSTGRRSVVWVDPYLLPCNDTEARMAYEERRRPVTEFGCW